MTDWWTAFAAYRTPEEWTFAIRTAVLFCGAILFNLLVEYFLTHIPKRNALPEQIDLWIFGLAVWHAAMAKKQYVK